MATQQFPGARSREQFPPRPATPQAGSAQRGRLQAHLSGLRWWSAMGGLVGTVLFTALAVRHTDQASAAPADGSTVTPANAPSQSLFQGQGDSGGGFLGSASSGGSFGRSPFRSRSS
jgi:uncharacterized membrane protein